MYQSQLPAYYSSEVVLGLASQLESAQSALALSLLAWVLVTVSGTAVGLWWSDVESTFPDLSGIRIEKHSREMPVAAVLLTWATSSEHLALTLGPVSGKVTAWSSKSRMAYPVFSFLIYIYIYKASKGVFCAKIVYTTHTYIYMWMRKEKTWNNCWLYLSWSMTYSVLLNIQKWWTGHL